MVDQRQLDREIATIEGLQNIIHSMRSLAATYLRRAEERLRGVRAHADTIGRAIEDCLRGREIALPPPELGGAVLLAFFSEQGLCGRFNEVMADAAGTHAAALDSPSVIVVGKRGPVLIRRQGLPILAEVASTTSPDGVDAIIPAIARTVLALYDQGAFAQLFLLHARYLSPGRIEPRLERVLPLDLSQWRETTRRRTAPPRLGLPRMQLLQELIREYTYIALYRAMTESLAGENGMRLQSMEGAKSNIDEKLDELQLQVRMQRQREITEELLDVIAGADAAD